MARSAGKKQAPAKIEEDDDTEGWEDAVVETEGKEEPDLRLRDWRDVERYREMKELRRLVDDDYGLEEIFHVPIKPRRELVVPTRNKAPKASAAKAPAKPAAARKPARPKITAKAKRR